MLNRLTDRRLLIALIFVVFVIGVNPGSIHALSSDQRRLIDSGVFYYNIEDSSRGSCAAIGLGGGAGEVPVTFNLGSEPSERRVNLIRALIADYGLTAEQAAGPVGNFMWESGGDHLPPDVNQGESVGAPPKFGPLGYGWAQWSGGRQTAFIDYAVENGYMSSRNENATDAANYAYLKHELSLAAYTSTLTELRKQTTPEDAAVSFEATFERAGKPRLKERTERARTAFNEYQAAAGSTNTATNNCGGNGNAAIAGDKAFPLITTKSSIGNNQIFRNNSTDTAGHPYTAYDILVDPGTPVVAMLSGTVTRVSVDKCPGRLLSIYSEEENVTISYLHLSLTGHASEGQEVSIGEEIGVIGSAQEGCGTPHLHIDAVTGNQRPSCSRESCPSANANQFIDVGPDLFETYQLLEP